MSLRPKGSLFGALLAGLLSLTVQAQTNFFTDGAGTDPTPLDQYPSAAGLGWSSGWVAPPGINDATISSANPLTPGGGNYLTWVTTNNGAIGIRRPWNPNAGAVNNTFPYVVEWDYRCDAIYNQLGQANTNNWNNNGEWVAFENGPTGTDKTRGTFWVKAQANTSTSQPGLRNGFWAFLDGGFTGSADESRGVFINSTNVPFLTNTPFHFKMVLDPYNRKWEGSVTNLDSGVGFSTTASTGRKLNFLHPFLGGSEFRDSTNLLFLSRHNSILESNRHSLDNVVMYQVPASDWQNRFALISPPGSGEVFIGQANNATLDPPDWKCRTFYPAYSNFVFATTSFGGNTIPSNTISLYLNGVRYTGSNSLAITGTDADTNRTATFTGLKDNKNYKAQVVSGDQSGRLFTNNVWFDTFVSQYRVDAIPPDYTNANVVIDTTITNAAVVIEAENYNFDSADPLTCNAFQTDAQADRYIQNWVYPRYNANFTPNNTTADATNSYFARIGISGIDFFCPVTTTAATYWRNCELGGTPNQWRMRQGGSPSRPWLEVLGVRDITFEAHIVSGAWFNYTRDWGLKTNYLAYIRASAQRSNSVFQLNTVTNYTDLNFVQPTNKLGTFQVNVFDKKEDIRTYQLTDNSGFASMVPLSGKTTMRLNILQANLADSWLNYFVFVPVSPITLANASLAGTNFSFSFNSEENVHYTVQYKDALTDSSWTSLTNQVVGSGGDLTVTVGNGDGSSRLYRVQSP